MRGYCRARSMGLFVGLLLIAKASSGFAQANAMFTLRLDSQAVDATTFQEINLKNTLVKISSSKTDLQTEVAINQALRSLANQAANYPTIVGFEVDADTLLDKTAARNIAVLARKSVFVSTKVQFQERESWREILKNERDNPALLATVYGSDALSQLQTTPKIGADFVDTGVPVSHVFMPSQGSVETSKLFWMDAAKEAQTLQSPRMFIFLNAKTSIDYQPIIQEVINNPFLIWVGGNNISQFVPVGMKDRALVVWRYQQQQAQAFLYEREHSPQGLYAALGANLSSFSLIQSLVQRSQLAVKAGIQLLGDAENNIHTFKVLLAFANTIILSGDQINSPANLTASSMNILLNNPSQSSISHFWSAVKQIQQSIQQEKQINVFDYSSTDNADFYKQLENILYTAKSAVLTYNTENLINLRHVLDLQKDVKIKVIFGPDAQRLKEKNYVSPI